MAQKFQIEFRYRLGREARSPTLTYKGPIKKAKLKIRPEIEVSVASAQQTTDILAALGYAPYLTFEKIRESWTLGPCHVELDEVPYAVEDLTKARDLGTGIERLGQHVRPSPGSTQDDEPDVVARPPFSCPLQRGRPCLAHPMPPPVSQRRKGDPRKGG